MKLQISEKQLKLILSNQVESELGEQETPVDPQPAAGTSSTQSGGQGYPEVGKWESEATRGPGNQVGVTKWSDVVGSTLQRGKGNPLKEQTFLSPLSFSLMSFTKWELENPHDAAMIYGIAADFIPYVGPFLSFGIGMAEAQIYYNEGKNREAAMCLVFSIIPGMDIAKMIPSITGKVLTKLGAENLAKKIITKSAKLTSEEIKVVKFIGEHRKEIQSELKKVAQTTIKQARQKVQKQIVKNNIKTAGKKLVSTGGKLLGVAAAGELAGHGVDFYLTKKKEETQIQAINGLNDLLSQYEVPKTLEKSKK